MSKIVRGEIFNIQRFSTHDGPGIRTTVFLKGCSLRCFWCQNPESQSLQPKLLYNKELCTDCGNCMPICPSHAVYRESTGSIAVDRGLCTLCGRCMSVCQAEARMIAGRTVSVDEVIETLRKDRKAYLNSGGGITLSGGEVTMQPDFAQALLEAAHREMIHTAIETTGYAPWPVLERLLEYTDYVLYDLKCMNPEKHRQGTGVDNTLILNNAIRIANCKPVKFRTPLIPDYNDDRENIADTARFIHDVLHAPVGSYELLRYNKMGEVKYGRLSRSEEQPHMIPQSDQYFRELQMLAESFWD